MKKLKASNKGSSLIEIVLAVVILGIITVPLVRSFVVGANTAKKSAELSDATVAAQSLVEVLSSANMDELLNDTDVDVSYDENGDGVYSLPVRRISGGSREFDALVTISADSEHNEEDVDRLIGVYSEIDAMISIAGYDSIAESDYKAECTPEPDEDGYVPVLSINDLSRVITINAAQKGSDYEVTVTAHYTDRSYGFSRSYSESAFIKGESNSDPDPDDKFNDAAFSVFLIYDAYYKTGSYLSHEEIRINKSSDDIPDYNVFLVNTSGEKSPPTTYRLNVKYQGQDDKTRTRVFTSLALSGNADDVSGYFNKVPVSGYLVEEKAKDRRYLIKVDLYRVGEGPKEGEVFEGEPVFSLDSKRLY